MQLSVPLLLLAALCAAEDPFDMFESAPAPSTAAVPAAENNCCTEAAHCRRLLLAGSGPRRARCVARMRRGPPPAPAGSCRRRVDSAYLRRHVTRTLKLLRLDGDVPPAELETFVLRARISEIQVLQLRQFMAGGDVSLVEVDALLEQVLSDSDVESLLAEGRPRWLRRLAPLFSAGFICVAGGGSLLAWLLVALLVGRPWTYVVSRLVVLVFLMSFFWHWNNLYQRALAERHLTFRPPAGCEQGDRGWTDGLLHYLRGLVSFVQPECREYQLNLHVDPFSEVSPSLALAEMLTKTLLHPAEQLGGGLGRFYRALGAEVPTVWLPLLMVISLVFVLALLAILCRCPPAPAQRSAADALHVTVQPGEETVYLVVGPDGEVQPVGEAARRRTAVRSAGPERVGWLLWTGRGLLRSLSVGAAAAAALGRSALARHPPPAVEVTGAAADPPSPQRTPAEAVAAGAAESRQLPAAASCCCDHHPAAVAAAASGGGDQPRLTDLSCVGRSPGRSDGLPAGDGSPVTPVKVQPPEGGDGSRQSEAAAEVAPRGGADESVEQPASPFLVRIKEVMDTSLEGDEA